MKNKKQKKETVESIMSAVTEGLAKHPIFKDFGVTVIKPKKEKRPKSKKK